MNHRTPICDSLGSEIPILLAGVGGVSRAEVGAVVSEAVAYGTQGMATLGPEKIRDQMREVRRRGREPFGVDLLAALSEQMLAAIDVIVEKGASGFIAGQTAGAIASISGRAEIGKCMTQQSRESIR